MFHKNKCYILVITLFVILLFLKSSSCSLVEVHFYPKNWPNKPIILNENIHLDNTTLLDFCISAKSVKYKAYIIIHEFLSSSSEEWAIERKNKLIKLKNTNVLAVDWSNGADWSLNLNFGYVNAVSELETTARHV